MYHVSALSFSGGVAIDFDQMLSHSLSHIMLCGDKGQYLVVRYATSTSRDDVWGHVFDFADAQDSPDHYDIRESDLHRGAMFPASAHFDVSPCKKFLMAAARRSAEADITIAEWFVDRVIFPESSTEEINSKEILSLTPSFNGRFVLLSVNFRVNFDGTGLNKCGEIWDADTVDLLLDVEAYDLRRKLDGIIVFSHKSSLIAFDDGWGERKYHDVRSGEAVRPPLEILKDWKVRKVALNRNGRLIAIGHSSIEDSISGEDSVSSEDIMSSEDSMSSGFSKIVQYLSVWNIESGQCVMGPVAVIRSESETDAIASGSLEDIWFSEDETMINVSFCHDITKVDACQHNRMKHKYQVWCIACGELKSESEENCCRSFSCPFYVKQPFFSYLIYVNQPFRCPRPGDLFMRAGRKEIFLWRTDVDISVMMTLDGIPKGFWFDRERKRLWVVPAKGPLGIVELVGDVVVEASEGPSNCNADTLSDSWVESGGVADMTPCACDSQMRNEVDDSDTTSNVERGKNDDLCSVDN